ncbi:sugar transferase [Phenylobacterium sp.]|jgi:lipopolysaccharide/colanic/teichoic acid biosynthesis glycosyltransferase|uniref:sugar transferase n=1 Tax=Phenylobacterium sp. TaxID=1871053 RepID=UPI002F92264A
MQRLLDILLSALALLLLSPLLLPLMLALRLTGEGKIFYVQQRVGRGGQPFGVMKFATMLENSPNMGTGTVTLKDDPRILPLGKFLRKTKINELPQLINILRGDMSVIGPRPQTQRCFDAFPTEMQAAILKVRPGLSGIGSIVFRDEEEMLHESGDAERFYDHVIMPYKGRLEEWYVAHQGLGAYLACIALTVWSVLSKDTSLTFKVFRSLPAPPAELLMLKTGQAPVAAATSP